MPVTPNTFYDLPPGASPTIIPVSSATGYCSASDVASLNKARIPGAGNNPTITDINGYIEMIAGQIDAVLLTKGYQTPVNVASSPQVEGLLAWINAQGAAYTLEAASPAPQATEVDRLRESFDNAMRMLTDGKFSMDIPVQVSRAQVRAPWLTFQPTGETYDPTHGGLYSAGGDGISGAPGGNSPRNPYLSRTLRF